MAKEKSVFHYLQDSLEFNFGIFFQEGGEELGYMCGCDFQNSNGD